MSANSSLKVLFVADSLDVGGAERVLIGLANDLVRRGHSVTVACSAGGQLMDEARASGVRVRFVGRGLAKRRVDFDFVAGLRNLFVEDRWDVVHTHMFASTVAAALALRRSAPPLVIHEHSEAGWRDVVARRTNAMAYRRSEAVIAVSSAIRQRLVETDGVPAAKVHLLPN